MQLAFNMVANGHQAVVGALSSVQKQMKAVDAAQKRMNMAKAFAGGKIGAEDSKIYWAAQKRNVAVAAKEMRTQWNKANKAWGAAGRSYQKMTGELKRTMLTITATAAAAGGAVYGMAAKIAGADRAAGQNAQKVGMMVERYSRLQYAFNAAGAGEETFLSGAKNLSKAMEAAGKGNKDAQLAFLHAGVAYADAGGKLKSADEVMLALAASLSNMPDGARKTALAMKLLGKSGADMIPALNKGAEALLKEAEFATRWGLDVSDANVAAAEAFHASQTAIWGMASGVSTVIGHELMPAVNGVMGDIIEWAEANRQLILDSVAEWVRDFGKYLPKLIENVKNAGSAIRDAAVRVDGLVRRFGGWEKAIKWVVQGWLAFKALKMGVLFVDFARDLWRATKATASLGWSILKLTGQILWFAAVTTARVVVAVAQFTWSILRTAIPAVAGFAVKLVTRTIPAIAGFAWSLAVGGAAAIASFAAAAGGAIIGALATLATGIGAAATAAWGFAAALLANPITWIAAGIIALGVAVYLLWKHWDTVTEWLAAAWDFWAEKVEWVCDAIVEAWDAATEWVSEAWDWLVDSLLDGLKGFVPLDAIMTAMNDIIEYIKGLGKKLFSLGEDLIMSIVNGILGAWGKVKGTVESTIKSIPGVGRLLGEPSRQSMDNANAAANNVDMLLKTMDRNNPAHVAALMKAQQAKTAAIPHYAEGGVVTRPTPAIVGEAGPEVIVPVTRRGRAMDLMATAADMMGMGSGSGSGGGVQVTYAPSISITGGGDAAGIKREVANALSSNMPELERVIEGVFRKQKRLAMA